jgi:hypothetical protein
MSDGNNQEAEQPKCSFRFCKVKGAELVECAASNCKKVMHLMCYQGFILQKNSDLHPLAPGKVACTKKCHLKSVKESAGGADEADGGNRRGNWDCDGLKGPDDPHTSVCILLDWWMAQGNYSKFCGKNNSGLKKIQMANVLAEKMSKETKTVRDGKNVLSKVQHIERTFKEAHTFAVSETGAGVKEDDEGSFKEIVMRKCPYYYDLVDIMSDRASSKPKATSYDLMEEEESHEDEDLSDLSEAEGKSVAKSVGGNSMNTKRSSSNKKKRKGSSPLMDDEALAALTSASQASEAKMKELVRHHHFLESIEEKKLRLEERREERASNSLKGKTEELDYKMQLLDRYAHLKQTYGWSDDQIIAYFPDMKQVVNAKNGE